MNKRGVELAFGPIVYAILAVVVIVVLVIIFRDRALLVAGVEDACGEGLLEDHVCYWERPGIGTFCFEIQNRRCTEFSNDDAGEQGDRTNPLCCRVG